MIRLAEQKDILPIADTYTELLQYEREFGSHTNWQLGVYTTIKVPEEKVPAKMMYVLEENQKICASMVLNQEQPEEYREISWNFPAADENVLVIHTLCIPPSMSKRGYGKQMVAFAKSYAVTHGCHVIRIDTYARNEPAKGLYLKNGFQIACYGRMLLQGLIEEEQVYLEIKL